MIIAVDLRPLQNDHRFRGIGIQLSNFLRAMASVDDGTNRFIFFRWPGSNPLDNLSMGKLNFEERLLPEPKKSVIADKITNILSRQISLNRDEADVFLQADMAYGRCGGSTPTVGISYDLIELVFRDRYYPRSPLKLLGLGPKYALGNRLRYYLFRWQLAELGKCSRIIAISSSTRKDLVRYLRIPEEKISVCYLAYDSRHYLPGKPARPAAEKPYLLYLGGADFRKNVGALVKSFDELRAEGKEVQLVLAGKDFLGMEVRELADLRRAIESSRFRKDIVLLGFQKPDEAADLYRGALAFVFPSLYEGFGIPPLEAMACGCPVVAFNNSSIPEVVDDAGLLVEPAELTEALRRVSEDEGLRWRLAAAGTERARQFSWERNAREVLKVLKEAAK